mmetsp:Transcript_9861/g.13213  ORF Transcript_9861/g.13213 Transcript_9861/m.13213 type:complete len:153 (+) Transcript_9861:78-536(+)
MVSISTYLIVFMSLSTSLAGMAAEHIYTETIKKEAPVHHDGAHRSHRRHQQSSERRHLKSKGTKGGCGKKGETCSPPTDSPTASPTSSPTAAPTANPTASPSAPEQRTGAPVPELLLAPTAIPTESPVKPPTRTTNTDIRSGAFIPEGFFLP